MRCYFTGDECDCGGDMETECPHDEPPHEEFDWLEDHPVELSAIGQREAETSERLDACQSTRR